SAARWCVDPLSDPAHCGGCGLACKPGTACEQGSCVCSSPLTDCGVACADLGSDSKHCGACNAACGAGAPSCENGACRPCTGGTTECAAACVNTQIDNQNCGACG